MGIVLQDDAVDSTRRRLQQHLTADQTPTLHLLNACHSEMQVRRQDAGLADKRTPSVRRAKFCCISRPTHSICRRADAYLVMCRLCLRGRAPDRRRWCASTWAGCRASPAAASRSRPSRTRRWQPCGRRTSCWRKAAAFPSSLIPGTKVLKAACPTPLCNPQSTCDRLRSVPSHVSVRSMLLWPSVPTWRDLVFLLLQAAWQSTSVSRASWANSTHAAGSAPRRSS